MAKSEYCPGADSASKHQTMTITAQENVIKLVGDTVDSEENASRFEVAAKCDGRDDPMTDHPILDLFALKRIGTNALDDLAKKGRERCRGAHSVVPKDWRIWTTP